MIPKNNNTLLAGFFLLGVFVTVLLVYLTPLQNIRILPPTVEMVEASVFYEDFQKNPDQYVFVDIRPQFIRFEYPEGSINMSIFNFAEEAKKLKEIAKGKTIVVFCEEEISESVAYGYLEHQGFTDILAIERGRKGWKEAGLPLVRNENYNEEAEPFLYYFREGGLLPKTQ